MQQVFEWFYVLGAVKPTTGDGFFLAQPYLNTAGFQIFIET
jgi:hypothetical protein